MAIQKRTVSQEKKPQFDVVGSFDIMEGMPENIAQDMLNDDIPPAWEDQTDYTYKSPLTAATPVERPGYKQQWIRIRTADGKPDAQNKAAAFRRGWRPRLASTLAKNDICPIYKTPQYQDGVIIFNEDLLLCEMQEERYNKLVSAIRREADRVSQAIYQGTKEHGLPESVANIEPFAGDNLVDD